MAGLTSEPSMKVNLQVRKGAETTELRIEGSGEDRFPCLACRCLPWKRDYRGLPKLPSYS